MNRVSGQRSRTAKATTKQPQKSLSTKTKPLKQGRRGKKVTKLSKSASFAPTVAAHGVWTIPQDKPGDKVEPYVDFFKDTPVNGLAEQLVRDMRDFFLIQTGSPQYFDRDYDKQKLLGKEQYAAIRKQMEDNNYGTFRGHDELRFDTSYYKRVGMRPASNPKEPQFVKDPTIPRFVQPVSHVPMPCQLTHQPYLDFRRHELQGTGCISAGPYYVPTSKFQFPILSIDNDFFFFHD